MLVGTPKIKITQSHKILHFLVLFQEKKSASSLFHLFHTLKHASNNDMCGRANATTGD